MQQELDSIEAKMTQSSHIDLTDIHLETKADLNVASGLLEQFQFSEPKEAFELEPEFEGDAKMIIS